MALGNEREAVPGKVPGGELGWDAPGAKRVQTLWQAISAEKPLGTYPGLV